MAAKRYKCPYCEKRLERKVLITHVDDEHEDMIPKGYTASRVVYNTLNKREHGTCMICKKETKWDESKQRYDTLCGSKKCHDEYVKMARSRMVHKYGSYNLLNDPEFQKKMLAGRKISGTYKFQDSGKVGYVGSYEKKFLEFMDKFLNIKSYDIVSPGPTIPYIYDGKEHTWITDFLYEPYNLVFDIKDGGDNPNTRDMKEYREKQIAKEKAIAEYGDYNYIRLTDNKFEQLILLMMELKDNENNTKPIIKINESYISEETRIDDDSVPEFIYHVSTVNHDGEVFEPRYYDNDNVSKNMERRVKRVCFSDSINGAIYSIFPNGTYDIDLYIHVPGNKVKVYSTTTDDIYDSDITHELWVKELVEMKCIGKIHISGTSSKKYKTLEVDKEKSGYGKRKYYEPIWSWVEKYDKEAVTESIKSYTAFRAFVGMMNPLNWGKSGVYDGDFDSIKPRLLDYAKKCKTKDDIDYLRKDLSVAKNQLNAVKKSLQEALDNPNDKRQKYEEMRKRAKKGLSVKKIDDYIKWLDEVYCQALNDRAKEIKAKSIKESSLDSNIDTVIFDIGDVLVTSDFEGAVKSNENIPDQFADELIKAWLSIDVDFAETCTKEEYMEEVKKRVDPRLHQYIPEILKCSIDCVKPTEWSYGVIRRLKKNGIKVYYLSNWGKWSFEELLKKDYGITSLLDKTHGGIVSYQVGFKKPDKKIYQLLIDKYNLDPLKCIFYDDKPENIEAARSLGLNAEVFNYEFTMNMAGGLTDYSETVKETHIIYLKGEHEYAIQEAKINTNDINAPDNKRLPRYILITGSGSSKHQGRMKVTKRGGRISRYTSYNDYIEIYRKNKNTISYDGNLKNIDMNNKEYNFYVDLFIRNENLIQLVKYGDGMYDNYIDAAFISDEQRRSSGLIVERLQNGDANIYNSKNELLYSENIMGERKI